MDLLKREFVVREPLLVAILLLVAVVFSAATHAYSRAYDGLRDRLARQWFARGSGELANNHPALAVEDFRTALLYSPQNWDYRLRLAEALTQAGQIRQARNYYESLWQLNPKSGLVNLQLAALAARSGQPADSERYFNGAIFGDWPEEAPAHRREALFSLIEFYIQRGQTSEAESQLLTLSANLPEDAVLHTRVADLFSRIGDNTHALTQYRVASQINSHYFPALFGAGKAALELGDFRAAESWLNRALRENSAAPEARTILQLTQTASTLNPSEPGIAKSEKVQRTLRAFQIAGARLDSCTNSTASPPAPLISLLDRAKQWKAFATSQYLVRHPDQLDPLFAFASSVELESQALCGPPTPGDSALLALAKRHPQDEK